MFEWKMWNRRFVCAGRRRLEDLPVGWQGVDGVEAFV
jgi:hypothetical protein